MLLVCRTPSSEAANKESWTDRVPALSAAVTQLSSTLSTLKQRTAQVSSAENLHEPLLHVQAPSQQLSWGLHAQAGGVAAEEGQAWQRRITSLTGHLTGALSGSHLGTEHAKSQVLARLLRVARCGSASAEAACTNESCYRSDW